MNCYFGFDHRACLFGICWNEDTFTIELGPFYVVLFFDPPSEQGEAAQEPA